MECAAVITDAARAFDVTLQSPLQQNRVSDVWRVLRADGGRAVLKVYHNGMGNEAAGFGYLKQFNGRRAAGIFAEAADAVLMEDLPGQSLGDLARSGGAEQADIELAEVARHLHQNARVHTGLLPLETLLRPMLEASGFGLADAEQEQILRNGQAIARRLIAQQARQVPLHGDLHHDNVIETERGFCAFDAKGLIGDPAYELANAFRHPRGQPERTTDVTRARHVALLWAQALDVTPQHLLDWAQAKVTLTLFWQSRSGQINPLDLQHFQCFATARATF